LIEALRLALEEHPSVVTKYGTSLKDLTQGIENVKLQLQNGEFIWARLVIGADGANSSLRKLCQITTTGWDYGQSAIVATVQGTKSHQQTAFQRFAPDGPLALLPLADPYLSSIVWTTSPAAAKELCESTEDYFSVRLTQEVSGVMGELRLVGKRFSYALQTIHANQYAKARCVLVGDSAHTLHPLAGQGVNLGFLDAAALIEVLDKSRAKGRDWGALAVLQRYERKRKMHNQAMIWAMELFKRGFCSRSTLVQRLRNISLNWVDRRLMLKQLFANVALGRIGHPYTLVQPK
jgi:2-polyprenylphenol 6-hydroxylase